jgi:hypothetical protein
MTAKVFISHSSGDQKIARTICTALEHRGLVCWMASRDVGPGQNYMDAIVRAIRGAKVMVLVFSQNANLSSEILKELSLASKYKVNVIPARIEDVVPSEAFELEFATRQWIDLFDNWEREIDRLTSWIISIVPVESNDGAGPNHGGTAVHSGSPIPKSPQAPIIENRPELGKSNAETPIIWKNEEPPPSERSAKSQHPPQDSATAEQPSHEAPQGEPSPSASAQPVKIVGKPALKPVYWGGAVALVIVGLLWGGWVIAAQMAEEKARKEVEAAEVAAQAKVCAERFKRDAAWWKNLTELKKLPLWQQDDFIVKGGWARDSWVAGHCRELLG